MVTAHDVNEYESRQLLSLISLDDISNANSNTDITHLVYELQNRTNVRGSQGFILYYYARYESNQDRWNEVFCLFYFVNNDCKARQRRRKNMAVLQLHITKQ